jgi:RNAse (barnase) inhibitor barstar
MTTSAQSLNVYLSPNIQSKTELLAELSQKFAFPDYFGHNWDALADCLCDLSWIDSYEITLHHSRLPKLTDTEMKIYLSILDEVCASWKADSAHRFHVVFPQQE